MGIGSWSRIEAIAKVFDVVLNSVDRVGWFSDNSRSDSSCAVPSVIRVKTRRDDTEVSFAT